MAHASGGGTNLPAAVALAGSELEQQDADRKMMIVITDGASTAGAFRQILEELRKNGVETLGVGLGPDMEKVLEEFEYSLHVPNEDDLPDAIADHLENDLLSDLSDSRDLVRHSSRTNTLGYGYTTLACGLGLMAFHTLLPGTFILGLAAAALIHAADIRRTGENVMAKTFTGRTEFREPFYALTAWSRSVIRIEEAWHRLPFGFVSRSEDIAKTLGFLFWPIVFLKDAVHNSLAKPDNSYRRTLQGEFRVAA